MRTAGTALITGASRGIGAPRSVEEGAASVLWGVRLPPGGPTGGVFEDGRPIGNDGSTWEAANP